MSSGGHKVPSSPKTPDIDEFEFYYLSRGYNQYNQYAHEEKTPSPIKNVTDKVVSPNKFSQELKFISDFFTKKPSAVPSKIQVSVIHEPLKIRRTRLDFRDDYKCTICRKDNHETNKCWFRCTKPSCTLLEHDRNKCPYYQIVKRYDHYSPKNKYY